MFVLRLLLFLFVSTLLSLTTLAQRSLTQTIRGIVIDQSLQTPLPGATITLLNAAAPDQPPIKGTLTETDGSFRLTNVPVGRQTIRVSLVGYKETLLTNVVLDAGKELVLTVGLDELVAQLSEVTVKPTVEKNKPINEMATVSARTFSVEETQRFAAAVNDPARMATAYAGVVGADDGNNTIVIRGNTPTGLLWRMEGVEIPNPNHFANVGAASGGISILSAQLLANSDFLTGAFPAEYGNALSGVFDLKLRRGNNTKRENTIQLGVLGVDVSSEGPFSKRYKGSYLFNYRYSTLGLLSRVGVNVGSGVTTFQDFSFNVFLPTQKFGTVTLFGFGGLSSQTIDAQRDSTRWQGEFDRYDQRFYANTGAVGLTHSINSGKHAYIKTVVSSSAFRTGFDGNYLTNSMEAQPRNREYYGINKTIASSTLTYKFSAQHTLRAGIIGTVIGYNLNRRDYDDSLRTLKTVVDIANRTTQTLQAFGQWNYRLNNQLTLNAGLHYLRLALNGSDALEPRGSIRWAFRSNQSVSVGYGLHSQVQNPATYFVVTGQPSGTTTSPNRNLGFTRSHQVVLAYDYSFGNGPDRSDAALRPLRLKAETYYQSLFGIPVSATERNSFAIINSYSGQATEALRNAGKGRNYGAELTLEQFMYRNTYFLWSSSLYWSEYQGSDAIWRSTRWDGRFATSFLAGKEFLFGESKVLGLNIKLTYNGGYRDTPINLTASQTQGETVYITEQAFTQKLPDYFRTDVRFSWKRNRPRSTRTLSLDLQNATNRQNIFGRYFDATTGTVRTSYQTGLIPVLSYRVAF